MMLVDSVGRELIKLIQIDQDFCNNTYGVAPCTATTGDPSTKCFNTYANCQDKPNYDRGLKTITIKQNNLANYDGYAIPSLVGFTVNPLAVNIGCRESTAFNLGKFGSATIQMQDLPFSDNHLDPYVSERSYNPLERGTFWTKFLARNPYFQGSELRIYDGVVGQDLSEMTVRKFTIDKITNPTSSGAVTINCIDVMRKLDNTKSQYPSLSDVQLIGNINDSTTSIAVSGSFVPVQGQPVSGTRYLSIGDEVISYTTVTDNGSGNFAYSGGSRGRFGTIASSHDANDSCQNTIYATDGVYDQLYNLFIHAGFIEADLDLSGWTSEIDDWLTEFATLDRVIMQPVATKELIGDLARDCGFFIWFDEAVQKVKIKAIRPETQTPPVIDAKNIVLKNSIASKLETDERISAVFVSYNIRNPSFDETDIKSYRTTYSQFDLEASSENEYGSQILFYTQAKWLATSAQAGQLAERTINRYRDNTRYVFFDLDISNDLEIGSVFKLSSPSFVDQFGENKLIAWQVVSKNPVGDKFKVKAQEFYFTSKYGGYMADDANDYASATDDEKEFGCYYEQDYTYI